MSLLNDLMLSINSANEKNNSNTAEIIVAKN